MEREGGAQRSHNGRTMRVAAAAIVALLIGGTMAFAERRGLAQSEQSTKTIRYVAPTSSGRSWDVFRQKAIKDAQQADHVATMLKSIEAIDNSDADVVFTAAVSDAKEAAGSVTSVPAGAMMGSSSGSPDTVVSVTSGGDTGTGADEIGGFSVAYNPSDQTYDDAEAVVVSGSVTHSDVISSVGFTLTKAQREALEQQINNFDANGYSVSFMMIDVDSGSVLAYNPDEQLYSASTIKAPYLFSVFSTGTLDLDAVVAAEDYQSQANKLAVQQVLEYSDNKSYEALFAANGYQVFNTWAAEANAPNAGILYWQTPYEFISARDMARLWTRGYAFMFQHVNYSDADPSETARQWLASEMMDSSNSTIHMALSDSYTVYTKAGWINGDEGSDLYSLNDAGVVEADSGTYLLIVLSTAANQHGLLTDLISTIDDVHTEAFADETANTQPFYAKLRSQTKSA